MKWLRSLLTVFCFALFGLGGLIIGTIIFPFAMLFVPAQNQRLVLSNIVHGSWIFFVKVMTCMRLIDVKISGQINYKNIKSTIIVANHPSLLDIVLLISIIPNSICVVKSSLMKNFFIKHLIQRIYLLNDDNPENFLNKGCEILSQGMNIIIFPEGTRTNNTKPHKIHRGFAQLAIRAKVPVLPVQIDCIPLILGKNQKWYDVGVKTVLYRIGFLQPVKETSDSAESFHHRAKVLSEIIDDKLFKRNR